MRIWLKMGYNGVIKNRVRSLQNRLSEISGEGIDSERCWSENILCKGKVFLGFI